MSTGGVRPGYVSTGGVRPGYVSTGGVRPGYVSTGGVRPGYVSTGGVRPGYVSTGWLNWMHAIQTVRIIFLDNVQFTHQHSTSDLYHPRFKANLP